ncbi:hypothetical protein GGS20DRAFT_598566 [Poronia punctata]|nr:hypothetical protein GGS20DRAFT_598566 [Poronia punctata]
MRDSSPDDVQGLLEKTEERWSEETPQAQDEVCSRRHGSSSSSAIVPILSITNLTTIGIIIYLLATTRSQSQSPDQAINQPPQGVTPSLAHLIQHPQPTLFNVTFYPDETTPWRGHNSSETDKAWREYGETASFIMIPKEEAAKAAIDPDRHAYIDRPDIGMVGYPVVPEAVHQMHCLDVLRQNLYYNKAYTDATCRPGECVLPEYEDYGIWHIDHCVEILRHRIACTADLGVVPYLWYKHTGRLTSENTRMHTCADYDAVKEFLEKNGVAPPEDLRPPKGAYVMSDYDQ